MGSNSRFSKPAIFNILTLFIGIILHALSFQSTALASPIAENSVQIQSLVKRYSGSPSPKQGTGGPDVSDYPTDDEIRAAFIPPTGPFIFFSGLPNPQTNQAPFDFSQTIPGGTILRNAFPRSYINKRFKPNPQRSDEWYQNFLDRVSGIFADKAVEAGQDVYFVGRFDRTVYDCSIWKRIELPTLNDGGINIKLVDYSNFGNQEDYNPPAPPGFIFRREDDINAVEKRGTGVCFDWPGSGEDDNDPDSDAPIGIPYYPGACGVHIQQYQKNEGLPATNGNLANSNYRLTIQLKDANGELVGEVDYFDAPGGQGVGVNSALPWVFIATTGAVDDDAISFAYADQFWDSNSGQCSVGGYDSGSRQMDCGFTC